MADADGPQPAWARLKARVRSELQPSELVPNLVAGVVVGIIVVIGSISIATLIFHHELDSHLGAGIGLALFSGVLVTGVTALFSSYSGMIAYPQQRVAPILALIAASIVTQMSARHASNEAIYLTVVAAMALTAVASGLLLAALGLFKLGNLIRFIPYPVIGGFLAGTGWLLVRGSLGVMTSLPIHVSQVPRLFEAAVLAKWGVGVAFGVVLVAVTRRSHHYLTMPGLLLGGMALFHVVLPVAGVPLDEARASGWLLGPFPAGGTWRPTAIADVVRGADWSLVTAQWGDMATVFVIAMVSVLLNSGALELVIKTDTDLNRELRVAGAANVLIGLGGGPVGFHSPSISRLVYGMGAKSRLVGVVGALMCAGMLAVGTAPLAFLPRAILGGLLFFLGMEFLIDWVYDAYFRLTKADYAIVLMILLIVATMGYVEGVVAGIMACVVLFLVNYSRVDVVKLALTGQDRRSNVDRPARHARILQREGDRLHIFRLQGFIFFGTANSLFDQVRAMVEQEGARLRFLIFDFKRVTGIDSSSVFSFLKIRQLAETHRFTLIFTALTKGIRRLLDKEDFGAVPPDVFQRFDDLDYGLEWCENRLLEAEDVDVTTLDQVSFREQLDEDLPNIDPDRFLSYFEVQEVDKGQVLIRQGEPSSSLYIIDEGQVTAELTTHDGKTMRLRTMYSGTIVGEIGLILGEPRSASVVADRLCTVYCLSVDALKRMETEAPEMAAAFYGYLNRLMAERLSNNAKTLEAILG